MFLREQSENTSRGNARSGLQGLTVWSRAKVMASVRIGTALILLMWTWKCACDRAYQQEGEQPVISLIDR